MRSDNRKTKAAPLRPKKPRHGPTTSKERKLTQDLDSSGEQDGIEGSDNESTTERYDGDTKEQKTKAAPLHPKKPRHGPTTLEERKRKTSRIETTCPEPSHASGDLSEEQDGIEECDSESTTGQYDGDIKIPENKKTETAPLRPIKPLHDLIPTSKEKERKTSGMKITSPEPSHASRDLSEEQDGIEERDSESTTRHYDGDIKILENKKSETAPLHLNKPRHGPTTSKERKRKTSRMKITCPEPSHASGDLPEEQDGIEECENESTTGRYEGDVTTVRQRYRASSTGIKDRAGAQRNHERVFWQVQGAFLSLVVNDCWILITTILRLPIIFYPASKWLLLGYVVWLAITYLVASISRSATTVLAPICSISVFGPQVPFCTGTVSFKPKDRPVNISKVATSQDMLTAVIDQVGQNYDLGRDMVHHDYVVRDLRIRVKASKLPRKKELTQELTSLTQHTKELTKGLARFTAKFGKSIDIVKTFNGYAVKALEGISEQQRNPPTLLSRITSTLSPFAAFSLVNTDEEEVKHLFILTTARISDKVNKLIDESYNLTRSLTAIEGTLDRIKELALDEIGDLPRMDVLSGLWARLARNDHYGQYKSHALLLTHMTKFYENSSYVMRETTAALDGVQAEMTEFREDIDSPGLILEDNPLEVIIELLKLSSHRLEAGNEKLEQMGKKEREWTDDV